MALILERELATFRRELPKLLAAGQANRYTLIFGDEVVGTWDTFDEAAEAGYLRSLTTPFLVKQVAEREEPVYFSRSANSCR